MTSLPGHTGVSLASPPSRSMAPLTAESTRIRGAQRALRIEIENGRLGLEDVLLPEPREAVRPLACYRLVGWCLPPRMHTRLRKRELARFNARAMRDGVNIMSTVGSMTERQRRWLVENPIRETKP